MANYKCFFSEDSKNHYNVTLDTINEHGGTIIFLPFLVSFNIYWHTECLEGSCYFKTFSLSSTNQMACPGLPGLSVLQ